MPQPQNPGFYSERDLNELEVDPSSKAFSANETFSQSLCSENRPRRAARRLGGR
ncbi:unnamed protein product [Prunus brigantina]